ncbi:MAG: hydrogenase nickel incorporation protein HypA/HybF [Solirubrobacteraceae bacterium]|jgi:hydrogenase nickel incorporation protein HypA/HybF|nr:hydrogenase nickel incorporation protein HypA/HybF [Solirubrobacteraceae bacterium]
MHELSVSSAVLESVLRHAAGRRVRSVHLQVGHLRQVVPDSLDFYWGIVTRDSLAEGSVLEQEAVPARLACRNCEQEWGIDMPIFRCPGCGGADVSVAAGDELLVESIEVEEEEPACTA